MRHEELQYIADSIALEKWAKNSILQKEAGFLSSLMGNLGSSIAETGKDLVGHGNLLQNLTEMFVSGWIFRANPILGIIYTVASDVFGLNLSEMAMNIIKGFSGKLESPEGVSSQEITEAAKNEISSKGGTFAALNVMLEKVGAPSKGIGGLFSSLPKNKFVGLAGGIIAWLIKTLLIGAGLKVGEKFIHNQFFPGSQSKPSTSVEKSEPKENPSGSTFSMPQPSASNGLKSSGRGEQFFPNDDQHYWVVPLINGDIADTLLTWATDIYPELQGHESVLENSSNFQRMLYALKNNWKSSSPNRLEMPKGLHSRKQVVDFFASKDVK